MRWAYASQQPIRRPEVSAVHSYVANTTLVIACNKWTRHPRVTAETWLLDRSRDHSQANFFELRARMNFFMNRPVLHHHRLDGLSHALPPTLIHVGGVRASPSPAHQFSPNSLQPRETPHPP